MALFYAHGMPEFKAMKTIYAHRVHKFVAEWLGQTRELTADQQATAWENISMVKLGNLLKPDTIRPKKYKNKYICFCEIVRPRLREEFPEKSIKEITKIMGSRWREFSEDRDPELYAQVVRLWQEDQKRYSTERSLSDSLGRTKKDRDSKYIQFCKQERKKNPKISMIELAELWGSDGS